MSSARAQANHKLYLAKIQLSSWRQALAAEDIPATTLTQAFLPAVREHLLAAYGWFLLHVSGCEAASGRPPRGCAELPGVVAGKAVPGEIREFQQLENDGWLGALLREDEESTVAAPTPGNLARSIPGSQDCELVQHWVNELEALFDRMSDSLEEY